MYTIPDNNIPISKTYQFIHQHSAFGYEKFQNSYPSKEIHCIFYTRKWFHDQPAFFWAHLYVSKILVQLQCTLCTVFFL